MNTADLFDALLAELELLGFTEPPHDPLSLDSSGCLVIRAPLPAELREHLEARSRELGRELARRLWELQRSQAGD